MIKRYKFIKDHPGEYAQMVPMKEDGSLDFNECIEDTEGEWVKWDDVYELLKELCSIIEEDDYYIRSKLDLTPTAKDVYQALYPDSKDEFWEA